MLFYKISGVCVGEGVRQISNAIYLRLTKPTGALGFCLVDVDVRVHSADVHSERSDRL